MLKRIISSPVFLIGFLIVIYFFPVIFQNQVFYYGDTISIFLPLRQFFFNHLRQGIFPLWNQNIYSGYPFFADMTLSNYYLPALILFFETTARSVTLLLVAHFFLAGFFMYRLGQLLKLSSPASFFISLIYTFSGILVNYMADPQRFFVIALFPLFFYCFIRAFKVQTISSLIFCSLALSLQIFAGHIQYVFIELLICPIIIGFLPGRLKSFKILAAIVILSLLFTAVSLLPVLEFIPFTTRPEAYKDLSIFQSYSLNPITLIRFMLANFWGIKNQGSSWGTLDTTSIGYIGFLPLLIIGLNIKKLIHQKITLSFLLIAVASLIISFGTYLPFFNIFTTYIPIFRFFRNPMVFLSLYSFFMALLAGYSYDVFKFKPKNGWLFFGFFFIAIGSGIALLTVWLNPNLPHLFLLQITGLINKTLSTFHNFAVDQAIATFILKNLIIVSLFGSLVFWFKRRWLLIALTIVDLFFFTRSNLYLIDYHYFTAANPIMAYLAENLGNSRFLSSSEAVPYSGLNDFYGMLDNKPLPTNEIGSRLAAQLKLIPPNFSSAYGLPTINGYTSFVMKAYNDAFQISEGSNPLYEQLMAFNPLISQRRNDLALSKIDLGKINLNDSLFNKLAVKYYMTDRDLGLNQEQLVFQDGDVSVYKNDQAQPRAVLLENKQPVVSLSIIQTSPNQLEINNVGKGKLVVFDTNYPGWQATVNNQPTEISEYDGIFRAIEVNEENSQVVFQFKPKSFYLGLKISLISLGLALGIILLPKLRVPVLKIFG
ncbi:MAG: hypothetical protein AAB430_01185 [Patescibacteria group bacterium]